MELFARHLPGVAVRRDPSLISRRGSVLVRRLHHALSGQQRRLSSVMRRWWPSCAANAPAANAPDVRPFAVASASPRPASSEVSSSEVSY